MRRLGVEELRRLLVADHFLDERHPTEEDRNQWVPPVECRRHVLEKPKERVTVPDVREFVGKNRADLSRENLL